MEMEQLFLEQNPQPFYPLIMVWASVLNFKKQKNGH
jgi:hypothetical protein